MKQLKDNESQNSNEGTSKLEPLNTPTPSPVQITNMEDGRSRLRVQFDITYKGHPGKTPSGVSDTVPDMTLSLGQLLERHSRGRDIPMAEPLYFDTEIPTFSDLTDVDRYKEQLERRLEKTKEFIKNEKQKQEQQKTTHEGSRHASTELTPPGAKESRQGGEVSKTKGEGSAASDNR